jgi:hypothetical protein
MTKTTDDLRKQVLAAKGSMTTAGLAEKFKLSHSTVRRILRQDGEADTKKSAANTIKMPVVEMKDTIPDTFDFKSNTIALESFTTKNSSEKAPTQAVKFADSGIEKLISDEKEDTDDFINTITEDDDEVEEDEEPDEDEEKEPYLFGEQSASNGRLYSMASKMEADEADASEAVMRLLAGEDDLPASTPGIPAPKRVKRVVVEPDDEDLRAKVLSRIYLNVINFKDHLPFIKNQEKFLASLHKKTLKELDALANLIETQRSLGNVKNQLKHLFTVGCQGTEIITQQYLGMDTAGFSQEMLQKQHELDMIFHELAIEQAEQLRAYTTPSMRLGMMFASTLMMTDNKNKMMRQKQAMEQKPASNELKQAYSDI